MNISLPNSNVNFCLPVLDSPAAASPSLSSSDSHPNVNKSPPQASKEFDLNLKEFQEAGICDANGKSLIQDDSHEILVKADEEGLALLYSLDEVLSTIRVFQSEHLKIPGYFIPRLEAYYTLDDIFKSWISKDGNSHETIEWIGSSLYGSLHGLLLKVAKQKLSPYFSLPKIERFFSGPAVQKRFIPKNKHADIDIQTKLKGNIEYRQKRSDETLYCIADRIPPSSNLETYKSYLQQRNPKFSSINTKKDILKAAIEELGGRGKFNSIYNEQNKYTIQELTPRNSPAIEIKYYEELYGHLFIQDCPKLNIKPWIEMKIPYKTPKSATPSVDDAILKLDLSPYTVTEFLIALCCGLAFVHDPKFINECHLPKLCTSIVYEEIRLPEPLAKNMVQKFFKYKLNFLSEVWSSQSSNEPNDESDGFYIAKFLEKWIKNHYKDNPQATFAFIFNFFQFITSYSSIDEKELSKAMELLDQQHVFDINSNDPHQAFYIHLKSALVQEKLTFSMVSAWLQVLASVYFPDSLTNSNQEQAFFLTLPQQDHSYTFFIPYHFNDTMRKQLESSTTLSPSLIGLYHYCAHHRGFAIQHLPQSNKELINLAHTWASTHHPILVDLGMRLHLGQPNFILTGQQAIVLISYVHNVFQSHSEYQLVLVASLCFGLAKVFKDSQLDAFAKWIAPFNLKLQKHIEELSLHKKPNSNLVMHLTFEWISALAHSHVEKLIDYAAQLFKEQKDVSDEHLNLGMQMISQLCHHDPKKGFSLLQHLSQQKNISLENLVTGFMSVCQSYKNWYKFRLDLPSLQFLQWTKGLLSKPDLLAAIQKHLQSQKFSQALSAIIKLIYAENQAKHHALADDLLIQASQEGYLTHQDQSTLWMQKLESVLLKPPHDFSRLNPLYPYSLALLEKAIHVHSPLNPEQQKDFFKHFIFVLFTSKLDSSVMQEILCCLDALWIEPHVQNLLQVDKKEHQDLLLFYLYAFSFISTAQRYHALWSLFHEFLKDIQVSKQEDLHACLLLLVKLLNQARVSSQSLLPLLNKALEEHQVLIFDVLKQNHEHEAAVQLLLAFQHYQIPRMHLSGYYLWLGNELLQTSQPIDQMAEILHQESKHELVSLLSPKDGSLILKMIEHYLDEKPTYAAHWLNLYQQHCLDHSSAVKENFSTLGFKCIKQLIEKDYLVDALDLCEKLYSLIRIEEQPAVKNAYLQCLKKLKRDHKHEKLAAYLSKPFNLEIFKNELGPLASLAVSEIQYHLKFNSALTSDLLKNIVYWISVYEICDVECWKQLINPIFKCETQARQELLEKMVRIYWTWPFDTERHQQLLPLLERSQEFLHALSSFNILAKQFREMEKANFDILKFASGLTLKVLEKGSEEHNKRVKMAIESVQTLLSLALKTCLSIEINQLPNVKQVNLILDILYKPFSYISTQPSLNQECTKLWQLGPLLYLRNYSKALPDTLSIQEKINQTLPIYAKWAPLLTSSPELLKEALLNTLNLISQYQGIYPDILLKTEPKKKVSTFYYKISKQGAVPIAQPSPNPLDSMSKANSSAFEIIDTRNQTTTRVIQGKTSSSAKMTVTNENSNLTFVNATQTLVPTSKSPQDIREAILSLPFSDWMLKILSVYSKALLRENQKCFEYVKWLVDYWLQESSNKTYSVPKIVVLQVVASYLESLIQDRSRAFQELVLDGIDYLALQTPPQVEYLFNQHLDPEEEVVLNLIDKAVKSGYFIKNPAKLYSYSLFYTTPHEVVSLTKQQKIEAHASIFERFISFKTPACLYKAIKILNLMYGLTEDDAIEQVAIQYERVIEDILKYPTSLINGYILFKHLQDSLNQLDFQKLSPASCERFLNIYQALFKVIWAQAAEWQNTPERYTVFLQYVKLGCELLIDRYRFREFDSSIESYFDEIEKIVPIIKQTVFLNLSHHPDSYPSTNTQFEDGKTIINYTVELYHLPLAEANKQNQNKSVVLLHGARMLLNWLENLQESKHNTYLQTEMLCTIMLTILNKGLKLKLIQEHHPATVYRLKSIVEWLKKFDYVKNLSHAISMFEYAFYQNTRIKENYLSYTQGVHELLIVQIKLMIEVRRLTPQMMDPLTSLIFKRPALSTKQDRDAQIKLAQVYFEQAYEILNQPCPDDVNLYNFDAMKEQTAIYIVSLIAKGIKHGLFNSLISSSELFESLKKSLIKAAPSYDYRPILNLFTLSFEKSKWIGKEEQFYQEIEKLMPSLATSCFKNGSLLPSKHVFYILTNRITTSTINQRALLFIKWIKNLQDEIVSKQVLLDLDAFDSLTNHFDSIWNQANQKGLFHQETPEAQEIFIKAQKLISDWPDITKVKTS